MFNLMLARIAFHNPRSATMATLGVPAEPSGPFARPVTLRALHLLLSTTNTTGHGTASPATIDAAPL